MAGEKQQTDQEIHRRFAADLFNLVWRYLERPDRTAAENDTMLNAAHASRYHWGEVGTPQNLAIGEWQISRVYAVLNRPEPARYHAERALDICQANGIGDFPFAYAYEALARAAALAGQTEECARYIELGRAAGEGIKEADDKEFFFNDLATVPGA